MKKTKKDLLREVKELTQFTEELKQSVEVLKKDLGVSYVANTTLKAEVAQARRFQEAYKRSFDEAISRAKEMRANREGLQEGLTLALQIVVAKNGDYKRHIRVPVVMDDDERAFMMGL